MSDDVRLACRLNGRTFERDIDPRLLLIDVVRDGADLKGARVGCGTGDCGACTVLVEGEPVLSCVVPAGLVGARAVTTLEGLGTVAAPGPMQAAFMAEQAAQCGFCIPGMMMRAQALLQSRPEATDAEIRVALRGNLCRCGTHMRILRAVRRAADAMKAARPGGGA